VKSRVCIYLGYVGTYVCRYVRPYVCIITRHPLPGLVRVQCGKVVEIVQLNTCVADGSSPRSHSCSYTRC
jgi:hypothetical protein